MKDFFKILSSASEDGADIFEVEVNPNHRIFDGHFPGMPVVPGVCTLAVIKECSSMVARKTLRYDTIRDCKFLETIIPQTDARLTLTVQLTAQEEATWKLNCEVKSGERTMMKLKAVLIEA